MNFTGLPEQDQASLLSVVIRLLVASLYARAWLSRDLP